MSGQHSRDRRRNARRARFVSAHGRPKTLWLTATIALSGLALVAAIAYVVASERRPRIDVSSATTVTFPPGDVRLDAAQFSDGQVRFYRYQMASGKEIRFFVIRSSDGVIRAALDTCDVCYRARKGYRQVGDAMVCNNCGKAFSSAAIDVVQGGCNPVPLERTVDGTKILLTAAALETGVAYF